MPSSDYAKFQKKMRSIDRMIEKIRKRSGTDGTGPALATSLSALKYDLVTAYLADLEAGRRDKLTHELLARAQDWMERATKLFLSDFYESKRNN